MARRRLRREEEPGKPGKPQLLALFGIGIMIISSLAYAILYKPPGGERQEKTVEGAAQLLPPPPLPSEQDSDGDGLPDALEAQIGTDPLVKDTPASLEDRRSQIYDAYVAGKLSLEEYKALVEKLDEAERLLR